MATITQTSGREGFTLIELLVVIAIIAILAAIAVPVLARAAAHARDVKCVSNCRQLSQALIQYTGHYDGSFPCCYNTDAGWGEWKKMTWREKILPIVAGNIGELRLEDYTLPEDASIFKCSGRSLWPTTTGVQSIYGVNAYISIWPNNVEQVSGQDRHLHVDAVQNTSDTCLVTENDDGDFAVVPDYATSFPYSGRSTGTFHTHHRNDRAGVGYCDGRSGMFDTRTINERKLYIWKVSKKNDSPQ